MVQAVEAERARRARWGFLSGATMALGASLSFAAARAGILGGLGVADLIFARFLVAGAIMLPLLVRWGLPTLAGIGLRRAVILTALGGAPFALLQTGGYGFAPLAHGAVIAPSTVTIVSTIGAALFLRERLGPTHLAGAAIVLLGIGLIGWDGIAQSTAKSGERAPACCGRASRCCCATGGFPPCAPPPSWRCCRWSCRRRSISCGWGRAI